MAIAQHYFAQRPDVRAPQEKEIARLNDSVAGLTRRKAELERDYDAIAAEVLRLRRRLAQCTCGESRESSNVSIPQPHQEQNT